VAENIHATAIVVGTAGLVFVGPPGSGKSTRAFACLAEAKARGLFAALVADDRVLVSTVGGVAVATAPPAIAGKLELRGSGIVELACLPRAVLHLAIMPGEATGAGRLPDGGERFTADGLELPAIRLLESAPSPLSALAALRPNLLRLGGETARDVPECA